MPVEVCVRDRTTECGKGCVCVHMHKFASATSAPPPRRVMLAEGTSPFDLPLHAARITKERKEIQHRESFLHRYVSTVVNLYDCFVVGSNLQCARQTASKLRCRMRACLLSGRPTRCPSCTLRQLFAQQQHSVAQRWLQSARRGR